MKKFIIKNKMYIHSNWKNKATNQYIRVCYVSTRFNVNKLFGEVLYRPTTTSYVHSISINEFLKEFKFISLNEMGMPESEQIKKLKCINNPLWKAING